MDWTIRLGDIFVLGGILWACGMLFLKMGGFMQSVEVMKVELADLKSFVLSMRDVLTTLAVQKNELNHLRDDVTDLRHGRGFVISQQYPLKEG